MAPTRHTTLTDTSPLPEGWSPLEIVEDTILVEGALLHRAGLASVGPEGEEVTGSGAEADASPVRRSYFELLERVATLEALRRRQATYSLLTDAGMPAGHEMATTVFPESEDPARWRYARSNGVALHADWQTACTRARWELAERDRILRSWYGEIRPVRLAFPPSNALASIATYDWRAYAFPEPNAASFSLGAEVAGVFGFPDRLGAPLVMGFGARGDAAGALDAAGTEATQLLAFLWGEASPETAPAMGPTPVHHIDRFQWRPNHRQLRDWLDGAHEAHARSSPHVRVGGETTFVDLTPTWLTGGLRVAKAVCETATPLTFGDSPFGRHLPAEVRGHPIG
jgi:hypothetical protein